MSCDTSEGGDATRERLINRLWLQRKTRATRMIECRCHAFMVHLPRQGLLWYSTVAASTGCCQLSSLPNSKPIESRVTNHEQMTCMKLACSRARSATSHRTHPFPLAPSANGGLLLWQRESTQPWIVLSIHRSNIDNIADSLENATTGTAAKHHSQNATDPARLTDCDRRFGSVPQLDDDP